MKKIIALLIAGLVFLACNSYEEKEGVSTTTAPVADTTTTK